MKTDEELSDFFKINTTISASDSHKVINNTNDIKRYESENILFEYKDYSNTDTYPLISANSATKGKDWIGSNDKVKFSSFGKYQPLKNASYCEGDVVSVFSNQFDFGLGLAALGNNFSDYKDYFGETLVFANNIFI